MSGYYIGEKAIETYGFAPVWINPSGGDTYILSGTLSLPKRTGKTHHNWGGVIEPYVDADDMAFDVREFEWLLTAKATSLEELNGRLTALYAALGDSFTLNSDLQGSFEVIPSEGKVTHYRNGWGMVAIKLRELSPMLYSDLRPLSDSYGNQKTLASEGIDGYWWGDLGFIVEALGNRYDLSQFEPLQLTAESHATGSRKPSTVTLKGTIKADSYADLRTKVEALHTLIARAGVRTIRYFDGSVREAFAVEGVKIANVQKFAGNVHWARLECKMIEICRY